MKNILASILGLILLAVLTFFCFKNNAQTIKQALLQEANTHYQSEGMHWVKTDLQGQGSEMKRIMILEGTAPSQELKERAEEIARNVQGIAAVQNDIEVSTHITAQTPPKHIKKPIQTDKQKLTKKTNTPSPYELNITKDSEGMVIMTGYVPNKQTKQALVTQANNLFMPVNVIDSLQIAEGAPKNWEKNALLSLEKLQALEYGKSSISDSHIHFEGLIESQAQHDKWIENIKAHLEGDYSSNFDVNVKQEIKNSPKKVIAKKEHTAKKEPKKLSAASCQKSLTDVMKHHKIHFNYNKATINKDSYKLMNQIIKIAKECPTAKIIIGGHTDSIGSYEYNKVLSQKRANSVKDYMVKKGVKSDRLQAIGYGERKPITSNMEKAGRAKNRRIEFTIQGVTK